MPVWSVARRRSCCRTADVLPRCTHLYKYAVTFSCWLYIVFCSTGATHIWITAYRNASCGPWPQDVLRGKAFLFFNSSLVTAGQAVSCCVVAPLDGSPAGQTVLLCGGATGWFTVRTDSVLSCGGATGWFTGKTDSVLSCGGATGWFTGRTQCLAVWWRHWVVHRQDRVSCRVVAPLGGSPARQCLIVWWRHWVVHRQDSVLCGGATGRFTGRTDSVLSCGGATRLFTGRTDGVLLCGGATGWFTYYFTTWLVHFAWQTYHLAGAPACWL